MVDGEWVWRWRRDVRGGVESEQLDSLLGMLQNFIKRDKEDVWAWDLNPNGEYTVAWARRWIDDRALPASSMGTRWNELVPNKVNIMVWRVIQDRIPTRTNLDKRGLDIPDIMCPICALETEHLAHLFAKCEVEARTWDAIFRWLELVNPGVNSVGQLFEWLDNNGIGGKRKKLIEAIIFTTLWAIWKFRNDQVFGSRKMRKDELVFFIKEMTYLWTCNRKRVFSCSWVNWFINPLTVM